MSVKKITLAALAMMAVAAGFLVPRSIHNANAATPIAAAATGATAATANVTTLAISIAGGTSCANGFFCYSPAKLTVRQGQTATWQNNTTTIHTVTICTASACSGVGPGTGSDPAFNSGTINPGATFAHQFLAVGTYNYYCQIHGYAVMHGTITVNPFMVKTASLPAGHVGQPYSAKLTPAGGIAPYHWSLVAGKLPQGLKLGPAAGRIFGTPTTARTATFTVRVTDSSSPMLTATRSLSITIS